jgi:hypothetical protein
MSITTYHPTQVQKKAIRLLGEGRVRPTADHDIYIVYSDHGVYRVDTSNTECPCDAHMFCSHLIAAQLFDHADDETLMKLHESIMDALDAERREIASLIAKRLVN